MFVDRCCSFNDVSFDVWSDLDIYDTCIFKFGVIDKMMFMMQFHIVSLYLLNIFRIQMYAFDHKKWLSNEIFCKLFG